MPRARHMIRTGRRTAPRLATDAADRGPRRPARLRRVRASAREPRRASSHRRGPRSAVKRTTTRHGHDHAGDATTRRPATTTQAETTTTRRRRDHRGADHDARRRRRSSTPAQAPVADELAAGRPSRVGRERALADVRRSARSGRPRTSRSPIPPPSTRRWPLVAAELGRDRPRLQPLPRRLRAHAAEPRGRAAVRGRPAAPRGADRRRRAAADAPTATSIPPSAARCAGSGWDRDFDGRRLPRGEPRRIEVVPAAGWRRDPHRPRARHRPHSRRGRDRPRLDREGARRRPLRARRARRDRRRRPRQPRRRHRVAGPRARAAAGPCASPTTTAAARRRGPDVALATGGLATSSTTVRRWRAGGAELHHIVDPRTGLPAAEVWRTVTVAAGTLRRREHRQHGRDRARRGAPSPGSRPRRSPPGSSAPDGDGRADGRLARGGRLSSPLTSARTGT